MGAHRRFDGYVRVSRVGGREGPGFISPTQQRDQITGWAALRGVEVVAWHEDLDRSGGRADRPGLQAAIARVEAGDTDGIVVAKLDRFARSLGQALDAIRRVEDAGGVTVSVQDGIDPTTTTGRMLRDLMLVFAEWELGRIRDQWRDARRRAVGRGVHVASATPTGYRRQPDGRLAPDPAAAAAIREAFELRAAGGSWQAINQLLEQRGVVGPYGNPRWTQRAASHILANRVYLGEARSGEFVNRRAHDPIVTRGLWERAQIAVAAPPTRGREPALLAGLLRCAGCRHLLKPDRMTLRDGTRVRTYRCRGGHAAGLCEDRAAVLGTVIEPWVVERFFAHYGRIQAVGEHTGSVDAVADAARRLDAEEEELEALRRDRQARRTLGDARWREWLADRVAAVDDARAVLTEAERVTAVAGGSEIADLEAMWPELPVGEQQLVLRSGVDAVMLRSGRGRPITDRVLVMWSGELPDGFPRRGRRVPFAPFDWPVGPSQLRAPASEEPEEGGAHG